MEEASSLLHNLLRNLSIKQKIVIVLGIVLIVGLTAFAFFYLQANEAGNSESRSTNDNDTATETYVDEQGYTVTTETHVDDSGKEYTTTTREDPYGNITTADPDLITTYFPYQVMREHKEWTSTLKYFLTIDEDTKIIGADMEDCDIENDKRLIDQYIQSIPIDLSDYTIEYNLISVDTDCGE